MWLFKFVNGIKFEFHILSVQPHVAVAAVGDHADRERLQECIRQCCSGLGFSNSELLTLGAG